MLTMKFEQVDMLAARMQATISPVRPGLEQVQAGVAEGAFPVLELGPLLDDHGGHDQAGQGPADGAEPLDHRAVGLADASGPLRAARGVHGQDVRLGGDADEAVQGEHEDRERVDAAGFVVEVEEALPAGSPACR